MRVLFLLGLFLYFAMPLRSQSNPPYPDVIHYDFTIQLAHQSTTVKGTALITVALPEGAGRFRLDLHGPQLNGKGMKVSSVQMDHQPLRFEQQAQVIDIELSAPSMGASNKQIQIQYAGIPEDGLIIGRNKFGDPTFFADHWPNRAHYWLPCHDVPGDKATVRFSVLAPQQYQVIANGSKISSWPESDQLRWTVYEESIPIPTKVMVIGVAEFAIAFSRGVSCIPHEYWVYPQDKQKGFYDFALGDSILAWFIQAIGPYSYEKMSHVQSTTRFGGMENAGAIFYGENTLTGNRKNEALLAHEIAHQWFGNAVTETDFSHIWLSEGFATYFTNRYLGSKYGADTFMQRRKEERQEALDFARKSPSTVVNPTPNLLYLLNAHSYQKGGFILYMLAQELGDEVFMRGVRQYYQQYRNKQANTADFKRVMESVSGRNLTVFFDQWLYRTSFPILQTKWKYGSESRKLIIEIQQKQEQPFACTLWVEASKGSKKERISIKLMPGKSEYSFPLAWQPDRVEIDPDVDLFAAYE